MRNRVPKLLWAVVLLATPAQALSGRAPDFPELVDSADLIAVATVTGVRSVWSKDKSAIFSYVTLGDLRVIEGAYDKPTLVLRQDGGEVAGWFSKHKEVVTGAPQFVRGERALLFIKDNGPAILPVLAAFRVLSDGTVAPRERRPELKRATVTTPDPALREAQAKLEAQRVERRTTLAELERLIHERARGRRRPPISSADESTQPESRRFPVVAATTKGERR
jgi:hypothetical protein